MKASRLKDTVPLHDQAPSMCDFCSEPLTRREMTAFPCRDFTRRIVRRGGDLYVECCSCHTPITVLPGDMAVEQRLYGGWGACPVCAALVRAGDREGLAARAAELARARNPDVELPPAARIYLSGSEVREHDSWLAVMRGSHEPFWLHREEGES